MEFIGSCAFAFCTFYDSHAVLPEGWGNEYSPFYGNYWAVMVLELRGCTLAYDGSVPYMESLVWALPGGDGSPGGLSAPRRSGYTFEGWSTDADSSDVVCEPLMEHITLDATKWNLPWTLEFDVLVSLPEEAWNEIPLGTVLYAVWVPQN